MSTIETSGCSRRWPVLDLIKLQLSTVDPAQLITGQGVIHRLSTEQHVMEPVRLTHAACLSVPIAARERNLDYTRQERFWTKADLGRQPLRSARFLLADMPRADMNVRKGRNVSCAGASSGLRAGPFGGRLLADRGGLEQLMRPPL